MMKAFLDDNFLLSTKTASVLYHEVARNLPIFDYHTHLPAAHVASDHPFEDMTEVWLAGDHYKWRAMRTHGVAERLVTGDASSWEKFEAWARTVPHTLRNPLYHWTHMELRRPFGITDTLLDGTSARVVYDRCNERLRSPAFTARGLLKQFGVAALCTTDDPTDSLAPHLEHARAGHPDVCLFPAWRPDRALAVDEPKSYNAWIDRLEGAANMSVVNLATFLEALDRRHTFFHDAGCRLSDYGLEHAYADDYTQQSVVAAFAELRAGRPLAPDRAMQLKSALLYELSLLDHRRGWVQQLHLGALRNTNSRLFGKLGPDTGCDSIGDYEQARPLARHLDRLDRTERLARTILYNNNPRDNELFATMIGNFQDGSVPGKLQYGSAWWFMDQKSGIERQLETLSTMGLLSRFVGMVTDSRSIVSYSRHEYFRRVLCELLGNDVEAGLLPSDTALLAPLIRGVCFENAVALIPVALGSTGGGPGPGDL